MRNARFTWLLLLCLTASIGTLSAQDPHFSQYNAAPMHINPGMTGLFSGNYRFSAIYRDQWSSILNQDIGTKRFRTLGAGFDMRFDKGLSKYDAFGVGLFFLNDRAGASNFGTNHASLSLAYHKSLNYQGNHYLSLGIQPGLSLRSVNYNNLRWGNQFDGTGFDPNRPSNEVPTDENFMFFDFNAGLFWYYAPKKRTNFYAGFSTYHINRPNQSFYEGPNSKLFLRHNGTFGAQFGLGRQVDILPSVLLMSQGPAFQTMVGSFVKIFFEPNDPFGNAVYIGPWYRIVSGDRNLPNASVVNSESLVLAAKLDISSFTFGLSYDLNFSDLTVATNARGGWELTVAHIGGFNSKSKVKFCPRF